MGYFSSETIFVSDRFYQVVFIVSTIVTGKYIVYMVFRSHVHPSSQLTATIQTGEGKFRSIFSSYRVVLMS